MRWGLPFDYMKVADLADWTERFVGLEDDWQSGGCGQECAAKLNHGLAVSIREKTKMSNFDKAAWQDMQ